MAKSIIVGGKRYSWKGELPPNDVLLCNSAGLVIEIMELSADGKTVFLSDGSQYNVIEE